MKQKYKVRGVFLGRLSFGGSLKGSNEKKMSRTQREEILYQELMKS